MRTKTEIRVATDADEQAMTQALSAAFYTDPVFQWIYPDADRRAAVLGDGFALFTPAINRHGASLIADDGAGAALWVPPGEQVVDAEDAEVFGEKLASLSPPDAGRLQTFIETVAVAHPDEPAWYLNFVGVLPGRQGHGIGGALLQRALHRADAEYMPAYLEATSEDNRRLYERHGFAVTATLPLPDGPSVYAMWRNPR